MLVTVWNHLSRAADSFSPAVECPKSHSCVFSVLFGGFGL